MAEHEHRPISKIYKNTYYINVSLTHTQKYVCKYLKRVLDF